MSDLTPPPCLADMRAFLAHPGPGVVMASAANMRAVMAYIDALEAECEVNLGGDLSGPASRAREIP